MPEPAAAPIAFGPFRLDAAARRLTRDGVELALGGRAFDTLAVLAAAAGETVSKERLLDTVWPKLVVEENNLQVQIVALRKLLGEGWIVTVPGRGYRLVAAPPAPLAPPAPSPGVALPLPDRPSIAVLPFANLGGDPGQEFFSDGIAEDILTELSRDRRLFVIGRASSFTYRGAVDLRQVGRELGVRYVLDGSVRRAGARLRVTARLNDAASGATLWTERYDREMADIFAVQDEITAAVTLAVGLALTEAEFARARRKAPSDLTAWEAYQRGLWHLLRLTRSDIDEAAAQFRRATVIDPGFAPAWVGWSQTELARYGRNGEGSFAQGAQAILAVAERALACDPGDPECHLARASGLLLAGDLAAAWLSVRQAERLAGSSPRVLQFLGLLNIYDGNRAEGRRLLVEAIRRDPLNTLHSISRANYSWSLFLDGEYEQTLTLAREAIHMAPEGNLWAYRHVPAALAELGRLDEAREAMRIAMEISPEGLAAYMRAEIPWQRPEDSGRFQAALRKAGWED